MGSDYSPKVKMVGGFVLARLRILITFAIVLGLHPPIFVAEAQTEQDAAENLVLVASSFNKRLPLDLSFFDGTITASMAQGMHIGFIIRPDSDSVNVEEAHKAFVSWICSQSGFPEFMTQWDAGFTFRFFWDSKVVGETYIGSSSCEGIARHLSDYPFRERLVIVSGGFSSPKPTPARPILSPMDRVRKSANAGDAQAQYILGFSYEIGDDVEQDYIEAVKWYLRASKAGHEEAQYRLANLLEKGWGVKKNAAEAADWYRASAEQGNVDAQFSLGSCYRSGTGVPQNSVLAAQWYRRASNQGDPWAQMSLAELYADGEGLPQDYTLAYKWINLAAASPDLGDKARTAAEGFRSDLSRFMSSGQIEEAQRLTREWSPTRESHGSSEESPAASEPRLHSTGTGFYVDTRGHVLTNAHVVDGCKDIVINMSRFQVHSMDPANDLAILSGPSAEQFLRFREGRGIRIGDTVVAMGFPFRSILGSGIQATSGEVSALSGIGNDSRYLQISAPVNPGNSGGPLLDSSGNVVGVVTAKLNAIETARRTGTLPENINFALKASAARDFLDMNGVACGTRQSTQNIGNANIVESAQRGVVLVECWR